MLVHGVMGLEGRPSNPSQQQYDCHIVDTEIMSGSIFLVKWKQTPFDSGEDEWPNYNPHVTAQTEYSTKKE